MSSVAITGVAGFLGQGVLRRLTAEHPGRRVVGLDVREPAFQPRELDLHLVDVARAELVPLLDGVDVAVHLAGVHDPIPDEELMARVNVTGTRRVLQAAGKSGVRKVVLVSSATVYGAWPNNPIPLNEDAPLRPNPGFALGLHKAEAERLLAEWVADHPDRQATVLRPATVIGPGADHLAARLLRWRVPLEVSGSSAPVQFVHEDDAVAAIVLAAGADLPGVYNVAADGWLSREDLRGVLGQRIPARVGPELLERGLRHLWPAGLVDLPPSGVPYLQHPWVVAVDRLRAAGWAPVHSNEEAVLACAERRPRRSRGPVAAAVAAGAGLGAVGVVLGARRRRR